VKEDVNPDCGSASTAVVDVARVVSELATASTDVVFRNGALVDRTGASVAEEWISVEVITFTGGISTIEEEWISVEMMVWTGGAATRAEEEWISVMMTVLWTGGGVDVMTVWDVIVALTCSVMSSVTETAFW
tara:strand:- start:15 stop:410 length:396 start_codon:yes stop_codon:yes gene_type:complete